MRHVIMENGKAASRYRRPKQQRSSKTSMRGSTRKSKQRRRSSQKPPKKTPPREEVISPDELLERNSPENERSESPSRSETTLTQEESNHLTEVGVELEEIKEEHSQKRRKSSRKKSKTRGLREPGLRKSQSGTKQAVEELRRSCYGREVWTPKSSASKEGEFNLDSSQRESRLYVESLKAKLDQLVAAGEYLKADLVYHEIREAKSRFSEVVVSSIKKELSEGEKMLNETLLEEEKELQAKFDELRQRIVDDFDTQVEQIEQKFETDKQALIDSYNQTEEKEHEKHFKKSTKLLGMEDQIRGLIKNREYRAAEGLKHRITSQMNHEVECYRTREEDKLNRALDVVEQKQKDALKTVDQKLQSALDELQIAFREQKEALKKRQMTLQRNFKNKEMLKLNRVNLGRENRKTVEKFRSEILRKAPFKNNRFRKTILSKENFLNK